MAGNTVKDMTTNFEKLDKFEGHDFRRWQKKMNFLLTTLKVVYVLTIPMPELVKDATMEAIRIRAKWENDDYICRGHILNGMSDSLFDVYTNVESAKELWDSLESKYMAEDFSSKKFLVSNFNNYKTVDSRPVMKQYNELLRILGQYTQHGLKMDESISVSSIIDKLPHSWKDFKHTLKHGKDNLSLVQLGSHLRIEESLRTQDSDKGKGKEVGGPFVKFLRALHSKWRSKVTPIEKSKDLSSLALDELIGNLKVHEVVMEKDFEIYRGKKERVKSIALKAKKESSDDETLTSGSDDQEYAMTVRNFKKFFRRKGKFVRQPREEKKSFRQRDEKKGKSDRKCFRCSDPNHVISDCPKPSRNKDQKAFIGGSWSDSENDTEDKTNDETCLMAQSSNEVTFNSSHYSDNASSLDNDSMQIEYNSLCEISLKIINKNKILKTKRDLLEKEILELNEKIKKLERSKKVEITCKSCEELKSENAILKETQVKFDKSANSLREMFNNQKSPSCKIGL
ncbi:zf-CCHC domain-containing protein [Tanacetum coccineum]